MRVAIFGSGPAGLLIAHAASQMGIDRIDIFSEGVQSNLYGAQYLHQNIPGIPSIPHMKLTHEFRGTIEGYREKVYGMHWDGIVSPEQYSGETLAYDIRYAYDWLWVKYQHRIRKMFLTGSILSEMIDDFNQNYDVIFSTIPRPAICVNPDHTWNGVGIWCMGDAPEEGLTVPIHIMDDRLICSGEPDTSWYRASRIFGHTTIEWSGKRRRPPITGVVKVNKPLTTTCNCWPNINFLGRYGAWKKGVLVHEVYRDAAIKLRKSYEPV